MSSDNTVVVSDAVKAFVRRDFGLFINGGPQPAHSPRRLDVFNPATGEPFASVPDADAIDVDNAV
ncbi:MAG TPA: NAD-dependent phenylacetaldehyde dehydrogenase, partial [Caballeronia sp.]|nr:NAD-dependent phenylacetaldehyde dehydrogenase [Caballeronia sp.]